MPEIIPLHRGSYTRDDGAPSPDVGADDYDSDVHDPARGIVYTVLIVIGCVLVALLGVHWMAR